MPGRRHFRWGDAAEDSDDGDDDNRIDDETVSIATPTTENLNSAGTQRRSWKKFGNALGQKPSDNLTVVSSEEIFLERTKPSDTHLVNLGNAALITCRTCGKHGDHWTSRCPSAPSTSAEPEGRGSYVPPNMRSGGRAHGGREENYVRVTNLSEDAGEQDLRELFGPVGAVSRAHVAFDRVTGLSRGFGFVGFVHRADAERAIHKLDGYGYDNLILGVEWATPRAGGGQSLKPGER